jgi:hypothetical protein
MVEAGGCRKSYTGNNTQHIFLYFLNKIEKFAFLFN